MTQWARRGLELTTLRMRTVRSDQLS